MIHTSYRVVCDFEFEDEGILCDEQDEMVWPVREKAVKYFEEQGWSIEGSRAYCPAHSPKIQEQKIANLEGSTYGVDDY